MWGGLIAACCSWRPWWAAWRAPSRTALLVLVRKITPDKVLPEIAGYGGEMIQTSLDNESEERLREALEARSVAVSV